MEPAVRVVRTKARRRLAEALGDDAQLAAKVESAIWNAILQSFAAHERYWGNAKFKYRYTQKVLSIAFNVCHPQNPQLGQRVRDGDLPPKMLVRMHHYEMFPAKWQPIFERMAHRALRRQLTVDIDKVPEGMLQCGACKSKKTTFTEMQTRSADEPMTVFALCLSCGKRWRQ